MKGLKLTPKLVALFLTFGILPMAVVGYMAVRSAEAAKESIGVRFENTAHTIGDKIDRNLFERYGDVQAFTLNQAILRREDWYRPGVDNQIVQAMDRYVDTYDIYSLTILVDLQGRLIAVNSHDADGNPVPTAHLYERNYASSDWFRAVSTGSFTRRMPFTAPGNDVSDGTFIEDVHVDEDVLSVYPRDDGLTIGFSAPVTTADGQVVAYWSNRAKFALVEEIVESGYEEMSEAGYPSTAILLLDSQGRTIVDLDPSEGSFSSEDQHTLGTVSLAASLEPARLAVQGRTGHQVAEDADGEDHVYGYTHMVGALGYPGMNWAVLVRVDEAEAYAGPNGTRQMVFLSGGVAVLLILVLGIVIGRVGTNPLQEMAEVVQKFSEGDLSRRVEPRTGDEVGDLGHAFNGMADQIAENLREATVKAAVVGNSPVNTMVADEDFTITYINPASLETLRSIEEYLPCKADEVVGQSIDFFHKNPAHQRGILRDPSNLPHRAIFDLGPHTLDLLAAAVYDENGSYVGPMVTWEVITEKVRMEREAEERGAQIQAAGEEAEKQRQHVLTVAAQVLDAANGVAASAEQLSANARQLSAGSDRQKGSVEDSAAAIQELAASSREVAQNMDELARMVTENSAALTELAASIVSVTQNAESMTQTVMSNSSAIEELAASIQGQADNAEQANRSAQQASDRATDGAEVVRQAIEGMERIAGRVRGSSERIAELGKSSEQVSTIVAVINDIADQTNLLALNAAIEAARAGEQGRGFAVVADEVRKLAERTSQATREIDEMIGRIQSDTKDVVQSMDEGMQDVEKGTELASRSGEALEEIGRGVEEVNELMRQLTASSKEQALTSDQIVQATAEMNELVQQVAKAMSEQSQAVDVVSQSSSEMQERVDQVSGAMREQQKAAEQSAGGMEEVNQLAQQAQSAAQEMEAATSQLARQAEDLNILANSFEGGGGAEAMGRRRQLLQELDDLGNEPLPDLLKWTTDNVVEYFDAFFSRVWLVDEHPDTGEEMLHLQASSGAYTNVEGSSREWAPLKENYKLGVIAQAGKTIISNKVIGDPQVKDQAWAKREGLQSFIGYPLRSGEHIVGVLIAYSRNKITEEEGKVFEAFVGALNARLAGYRLEGVTRANGKATASA